MSSYIKKPPYYGCMDEARLIEAASNWPLDIKDILSEGIIPSEAVQVAALSRREFDYLFSGVIAHLLNANIILSEAVQVAAIKNNKGAMRYMCDLRVPITEHAKNVHILLWDL